MPELCGAEMADFEHLFCSCVKVGHLWSWVKLRVVEFAKCACDISECDMLNLFVPDSEMDLEVVWFISRYVIFLW